MENKRIMIMGSIVVAIIVIFAGVFMYFSSKNITDLEQQLTDIEKQQKEILSETTSFKNVSENEDSDTIVKDILQKGKRVAVIENEMIKNEINNVNPVDAASDAPKVNKNLLQEMKNMFPSEKKTYLVEFPWFYGLNTKCTFNSVFDYKADNTEVMWSIEQGNRVACFVTASYDKDSKSFTDLKIYKTVFGDELLQVAYNQQIKNTTGFDVDKAIKENNKKQKEALQKEYDNMTDEEKAAFPWFDEDGDGKNDRNLGVVEE